MKQFFLVMSGLALLIGGVFFYDQILAIFKGMTVLESMQFIVTFILHVVVATICMYVLYTLPEIVGPWLKTLQQKRRALRRGRLPHPTGRSPKMPRLTNDVVLRAMLMSQMQTKSTRSAPTAPSQEENRIEF